MYQEGFVYLFLGVEILKSHFLNYDLIKDGQ